MAVSARPIAKVPYVLLNDEREQDRMDPHQVTTGSYAISSRYIHKKTV
jgi:hypothetical protein